ncbi:TorF family putative porin [Thioalkalicoccus limnaeus]
MINRNAMTISAASPLMIVALAAVNPAVAAPPLDLSADLSVVSNYLWRGTSQTDDGPAVQGGLELGHDSGFYIGTWASNVDFESGANYELDIYMGFDFTLPDEAASLGVNTIYYAYPDDDGSIDFWEIGLSGGYDFFSAGIQYTVWGDKDNEDALFDQGDLYYYAGLDFELPYELGLGIQLGYYDFTNDRVEVDELGNTRSANYWHWGVSISREAGEFGTFSFNYEQNDGRSEIWDNDPKFWIGWNKSF